MSKFTSVERKHTKITSGDDPIFEKYCQHIDAQEYEAALAIARVQKMPLDPVAYFTAAAHVDMFPSPSRPPRRDAQEFRLMELDRILSNPAIWTPKSEFVEKFVRLSIALRMIPELNLAISYPPSSRAIISYISTNWARMMADCGSASAIHASASRLGKLLEIVDHIDPDKERRQSRCNTILACRPEINFPSPRYSMLPDCLRTYLCREPITIYDTSLTPNILNFCLKESIPVGKIVINPSHTYIFNTTSDSYLMEKYISVFTAEDLSVIYHAAISHSAGTWASMGANIAHNITPDQLAALKKIDPVLHEELFQLRIS